jgi:hypothetical protein
LISNISTCIDNKIEKKTKKGTTTKKIEKEKTKENLMVE